MRIVIDSNQIGTFPPSRCKATLGSDFGGVTLAPSILAEILLRGKPQTSLNWLCQFDVLFGLDENDVFHRVARLAEREIVRFRPFAPRSSRIHTLLRGGVWDRSNPLFSWAKDTKKHHLHFSRRMEEASTKFRKLLRDRKSQGAITGKTRFADMEDLLLEIGTGPDSFLGSLVKKLIAKGGQRAMVCHSQADLHTAVLRNTYVSRFLKMFVYYTVSASQAWKDQKHNFDPNPGRDDMADMTLALYAGRGDVIVTRDAKLRNAIEMIEPNHGVTTLTL